MTENETEDVFWIGRTEFQELLRDGETYAGGKYLKLTGAAKGLLKGTQYEQ